MNRLVVIFSLYVFLAVALLMLFRFAIVVSYADLADIIATANPWSYIFIALKLDIRVPTLLVAPFALLGIFCFFLPQKVWRFYLSFLPYLLFVLLIPIVVIEIINYFFYRQYNSHITVDFLEFFQSGNMHAVFTIVWDQYPVMSGVFFVLILFFVLWWPYSLLLKFINSRASGANFYDDNRKLQSIMLLCVFFVSYAYLARGNFLDSFPTGIAATVGIAEHDRVMHKSIANGATALVFALNNFEGKIDYSNLNEQEVLVTYNNYYGKQAKNIQDISLNDFFIATDDRFSTNEKPNIIFTVLESFDTKGYRFATEFYKQSNLLGEFKSHIEQDLFYTNFLSATIGTIASLERMLFNAPQYLFFDSKYTRRPNLFFVTNLLRKIGYRVVFVTPGQGYWHNIGDTFKNNVDEFYGYGSIKHAYPEAEITVFEGLADHFMYRFIEEKILPQKQDKPFFIIALSWSNHQPYTGCLPKGYHGYPVVDDVYATDLMMQHKEFAPDTSAPYSVQALKCYAYAANEFGKFVSYIKNNKHYKDNTIISAVGDHYQRRLFAVPKSDILGTYRYYVPWYLYLPSKWREKITYNPKQVATHLDVVPTLLNLCCKGTDYFPYGHNIFAAKDGNLWHHNESMIFNDELLFDVGNKKYATWQDKQNISLGYSAAKALDSEHGFLADLARRKQQQSILLKWAIHQSYEHSLK